MKVYDFDKTIFYPDSSACFVRFCASRLPVPVLKSAISAFPLFLRWKCGKGSTKELKMRLFSFLREVEDLDALVMGFWNKYRVNIGKWYLQQRAETDVIVSASPEFLLRPVANELGFTLIGTVMDSRTGIIDGENCYGAEKVTRFRAVFPDTVIEEFYSDSKSDTPLAKLALKAFLVDRGTLIPWEP